MTTELRISTLDDICYIYGIPSNNFLKYYTLIKSIPIHIKSEINTNNTPCTQTTFVENILGRKNKTNKIFYTLQIKSPTENSKIQNKWSFLEKMNLIGNTYLPCHIKQLLKAH